MNDNYENNITPEETDASVTNTQTVGEEIKETPQVPATTFAPPVPAASQMPQQATVPSAPSFVIPPQGAYGYSQYVKPQKPEAAKKPSKNKKLGIVIASIIIGLCFLVAVCVVIYGVYSQAVKKIEAQTEPVITGDNTQMTLVEPPKQENSPSSEEGTLTTQQIYAKVYESSVGILVYSGSGQVMDSQGTGVVMGLNGEGTGTYVITCAHVLDVTNPNVVVQTHDGAQYDATIVGVDSKTDIGLVLVSATNLKAAEFANSDSLVVGDPVYAIGNPGGTQFFGSFTDGMVSAIGRPVDSPVGYEVACIQHTAAINPGNSGGALVNAYGQIVGINSSKIASTDYEGMGFAVPSSTVKDIVDQLVANGKVTNRPALGIQVWSANQSQKYYNIMKTNNLPAGTVVIDSIMNGSDLLNTDVRPGDMIIAVNEIVLNEAEMLPDFIEGCSVGDVITLKICAINANYQTEIFDVDVKLVEDSSVTEKAIEEQGSGFSFDQIR